QAHEKPVEEHLWAMTGMLVVPAVVHHLTRWSRMVFVLPAGHTLVPVDVRFRVTGLLVMMFHGYHTQGRFIISNICCIIWRISGLSMASCMLRRTAGSFIACAHADAMDCMNLGSCIICAIMSAIPWGPIICAIIGHDGADDARSQVHAVQGVEIGRAHV